MAERQIRCADCKVDPGYGHLEGCPAAREDGLVDERYAEGWRAGFAASQDLLTAVLRAAAEEDAAARRASASRRVLEILWRIEAERG
jgi:hypothetical protein